MPPDEIRVSGRSWQSATIRSPVLRMSATCVLARHHPSSAARRAQQSTSATWSAARPPLHSLSAASSGRPRPRGPRQPSILLWAQAARRHGGPEGSWPPLPWSASPARGGDAARAAGAVAVPFKCASRTAGRRGSRQGTTMTTSSTAIVQPLHDLGVSGELALLFDASPLWLSEARHLHGIPLPGTSRFATSAAELNE